MTQGIKKKKKAEWTGNDYILFGMAAAGLLFLLVFAYLPMFGILLAFKAGDYQLNIMDAILTAPWNGLDNFKAFLIDPNFVNVLLNTLVLNILMLLISFPMPILFALFLNEMRFKKYKTTVQTLCNLPHFISWVVFGGIILGMTNPVTGIFNPLLKVLGVKNVDAVNLQSAGYFWATIIIAQIIKGTGWGAIVYMAAISGLDAQLYEAAEIDGANRWVKMAKITLPSIAPTITVYLLLAISGILNNNFEQFYSFQNVLNLSRSEVLATYVYKVGLANRRYSYTAALGLFKSLIAIVLLLGSNAISKKTTGRGLW